MKSLNLPVEVIGGSVVGGSVVGGSVVGGSVEGGSVEGGGWVDVAVSVVGGSMVVKLWNSAKYNKSYRAKAERRQS